MPLSVDDVIKHAYDPVARRERYLRTRQLKGRHHGKADDSGGNKGRQPRATNLQAQANQEASDARQIAALKSRLAALKAELQKLLAEARSSSSSSSSSKSSSSKTGGGSKGNSEPKTVAQKAAAKKALEKARRERSNQAKTKPEKTDKPTPTTEEKIAHLRSVISVVQSKLRAAIEEARTNTASNGR